MFLSVALLRDRPSADGDSLSIKFACAPGRQLWPNSIRDTIKQDRRGVAQPGSASALGAEGRGFESLRPDQHKLLIRTLYRDCSPRICFFTRFMRCRAIDLARPLHPKPLKARAPNAVKLLQRSLAIFGTLNAS